VAWLCLAGKHFTFGPSDDYPQVRINGYFGASVCPPFQWRSEIAFCSIRNSPDVIENKGLILSRSAPNGRKIAHALSDVFSFQEA
jgi:hypothetical protein